MNEDYLLMAWYPILRNTGGLNISELVSLIHEFNSYGGILLETNLVRYLIAFGVTSQIGLINDLLEKGMLPRE